MNDNTHRHRMQRKKTVVDTRIAEAQEERGVLILLRGNGKGKSSSAFGTLARALGHGHRCAVVQFIKGRRTTGESLFFQDHERVDWHVAGQGFTWETQDRDQDIAAARAAWELASDRLRDDRYQLLVFDEMSYMFKYDYLDIEPVIEALRSRPRHQTVIITGRTMAQPLQDIADTISTVNNDRHAFQLGVKAQAGVEF